MTKYIDCEAAIAETQKEFLTRAELRRRICSIPAANVREVVRCKDCDMVQVCKYAQYLGLDGYCSNGERRGADMRGGENNADID